MGGSPTAREVGGLKEPERRMRAQAFAGILIAAVFAVSGISLWVALSVQAELHKVELARQDMMLAGQGAEQAGATGRAKKRHHHHHNSGSENAKKSAKNGEGTKAAEELKAQLAKSQVDLKEAQQQVKQLNKDLGELRTKA